MQATRRTVLKWFATTVVLRMVADPTLRLPVDAGWPEERPFCWARELREAVTKPHMGEYRGLKVTFNWDYQAWQWCATSINYEEQRKYCAQYLACA